VTNLDVTPVGRAAGAGTVRRRGWVRVVAGAIALVAGVAGSAIGILDAVDTRDNIESDAVARGTLGGPPLTFRAPAGEAQDYTVYLLFGRNLVNRELEESAAVRDTVCRAALPNERVVTFGGRSQGVTTTIGRASSVGHFSSPSGQVEVRCAYGPGDLRSRRRRPDSVAYVVTPGTPGDAAEGVVLIVGGVFGALAGGFLLAWGWRGSRDVQIPPAAAS
jgi:hypothetical protein